MICKNCSEGHIVVGVNTYYITHDMALDAGYPEMEGNVFDEELIWGMCECCMGEWQDCKRCVEEEPKESEE